MTTEPTLALQKAIVAALKGNVPVTALIAQRVYDRVPDPAGLTFPYVRVGEDEDVPELAECIDGSEVYATIHAFSRPERPPLGKTEVKRVAGAVKYVLHAADLTLDENRLVLIEHYGTVFRTDPDGLTEHAIITFLARTEPL